MNLRVATAGCPDASVQAMVFMGIRAKLDAFELQRAELLASAWQAQVTVVDIPGNGHGYARLSPAERAQLRAGRFDAVADRMIAAALTHHPRLARAPIVALGYSMGASLATAAAALPSALHIDRLVLVEPVATRRWGAAELLRSVFAEPPLIGADLDRKGDGHNADAAPHRTTGACVGDWPDLAHLGFALTRGALYPDMLRAHHRSGCTLQLIYGTDSRLARRRDVKLFTQRCRRAGVPIDVIDMPGHHAFWHSLPVVDAAARSAAQHWTSTSLAQ